MRTHSGVRTLTSTISHFFGRANAVVLGGEAGGGGLAVVVDLGGEAGGGGGGV